MNLSGDSVAKLARAHLESLSDLIVIYDDVDLPAGKLRIREKGSAGTHNGMRSIVSELGSEDFARLRFGVRGATIGDVDLADYVLDAFTADEERTVADALPRALDALVLFARGDLRRAMNTFNRDPETEEAKSE
jgi:PTH1 family peptidyl-tRNA hydrolase